MLVIFEKTSVNNEINGVMSNLLAVCSFFILCHAAINHFVGNFRKGLRHGRSIKNNSTTIMQKKGISGKTSSGKSTNEDEHFHWL